MKIIHCSDLHLDSRMEANLSFKQAQERNNEICTTFSRMVTYATDHKVSVIMIVGDLFDTERILAKTSGYFLDTVAQASEIDFLYLRGNHDESRRAFAGRTLPKNLKLFSSEKWTYYDYGSVTIAGLELSRANCISAYQTLALRPDRTNLVMLHGQEATQPREDAVCIPSLREKNIGYLALGHIHSYKKAPLDHSGEYGYCGCLEGRGFDECGEKGFVLLDITDQRITSEFIPFAKRKLHDIPVDITNKTTISEIQQAMSTAASDVPREDLVKFTLKGSYTLETQKDFRFLQQILESNYYFVKIKDESHLELAKESYENDISLKGEFIRMVMGSELSGEEKDKVICAGIQALSGETITF